MKRSELSEREQQIRDTAVRESWPMNDERANYPIAERAAQEFDVARWSLLLHERPKRDDRRAAH